MFDFNWDAQTEPSLSVQEIKMVHQEGEKPLAIVYTSNCPTKEKGASYGASLSYRGEKLFEGSVIEGPFELACHNWSIKLSSHATVDCHAIWPLIKEHPGFKGVPYTKSTSKTIENFWQSSTDILYFDPLSREVRFCDYFKGSQTVTFEEKDILSQSVDFKNKPSDFDQVNVWAEFHSTYIFEGQEDISQKISNAFYEKNVCTLDADNLKNTWPRKGEVLAGNYEVLKSDLTVIKSIPLDDSCTLTYFKPTVTIGWSFKKPLVEQYKFSLKLKDTPRVERVKKLLFKFEDGLFAKETFLSSQKGQLLCQHVKNVAKTYLLSSQRTQSVTFKVPFEKAKNLTVDHTVLLKDVITDHPNWCGKITRIEWVVNSIEQVALIKAKAATQCLEDTISWPDFDSASSQPVQPLSYLKEVEVVNDPSEGQILPKDPMKLFLRFKDMKKERNVVVSYEY